MEPVVAIVMPCKDVCKLVERSIASIEQQTFRDWILIAVNDASNDCTDAALMVAQNRLGRRMITINKGRSNGLPEVLNYGLAIAEQTGVKYIARMDADDECHPTRIQRQIDFMEATGIQLTGTWANIIEDGTNKKLEQFHPTVPPHEERRWLLKFDYFIHGSCMFTSSIIRSVGGYSDLMRQCEDYDLWFRIADRAHIGIVPEYLYTLYRRPNSFSADQVTARMIWDRAETLRKKWSKQWGITPPTEDLPNFKTIP